jgi:hypothetical protein
MEIERSSAKAQDFAIFSDNSGKFSKGLNCC